MYYWVLNGVCFFPLVWRRCCKFKAWQRSTSKYSIFNKLGADCVDDLFSRCELNNMFMFLLSLPSNWTLIFSKHFLFTLSQQRESSPSFSLWWWHIKQSNPSGKFCATIWKIIFTLLNVFSCSSLQSSQQWSTQTCLSTALDQWMPSIW